MIGNTEHSFRLAPKISVVRHFIVWVRKCPSDDAKDLVDVMQYKDQRHRESASVSCFLAERDTVMLEFEIQEIRQVLGA